MLKRMRLQLPEYLFDLLICESFLLTFYPVLTNKLFAETKLKVSVMSAALLMTILLWILSGLKRGRLISLLLCGSLSVLTPAALLLKAVPAPVLIGILAASLICILGRSRPGAVLLFLFPILWAGFLKQSGKAKLSPVMYICCIFIALLLLAVRFTCPDIRWKKTELLRLIRPVVLTVIALLVGAALCSAVNIRPLIKNHAGEASVVQELMDSVAAYFPTPAGASVTPYSASDAEQNSDAKNADAEATESAAPESGSESSSESDTPDTVSANPLKVLADCLKIIPALSAAAFIATGLLLLKQLRRRRHVNRMTASEQCIYYVGNILSMLKKDGLNREDSVTLKVFAEKNHNALEALTVDGIRFEELMAEYQKILYGGQIPEETVLKKFAAYHNGLKSQLKRVQKRRRRTHG